MLFSLQDGKFPICYAASSGHLAVVSFLLGEELNTERLLADRKVGGVSPVCLSVCLSLSLSVSVFVCLTLSPSFCVSVSLSNCASMKVWTLCVYSLSSSYLVFPSILCKTPNNKVNSCHLPCDSSCST